MEIEILNPVHPGFYESIVSPMANGLENQEIEYAIDEDEGYIKHKKGQCYIVEYDYKEYEKICSQKINDYFLKEINDIIADIHFEPRIKQLFTKISEDLDSPKEYNFKTDRSFIKVEVNPFKLIEVINYMFTYYYNELNESIKKEFTSYSGFISFYSNNIKDWKEKRATSFDHNELATIFKVLFDEYHSDDDLIYDLAELSSEAFQEIELKVKIDE
jgi:hypothetical protein